MPRNDYEQDGKHLENQIGIVYFHINAPIGLKRHVDFIVVAELIRVVVLIDVHGLLRFYDCFADGLLFEPVVKNEYSYDDAIPE